MSVKRRMLTGLPTSYLRRRRRLSGYNLYFETLLVAGRQTFLFARSSLVNDPIAFILALIRPTGIKMGRLLQNTSRNRSKSVSSKGVDGDGRRPYTFLYEVEVATQYFCPLNPCNPCNIIT